MRTSVVVGVAIISSVAVAVLVVHLLLVVVTATLLLVAAALLLVVGAAQLVAYHTNGYCRSTGAPLSKSLIALPADW